MPNKQDDMLNRLLSQCGSIAEKTSIAKKLDDKHLQMAVPHSSYARIEWERRAAEKKWYEKPLGQIAIIVVGGVLTIACLFLFGYYKH